MDEIMAGLDYLPLKDQLALIASFKAKYGPAPVQRAYQDLCHCPACRAARGDPPGPEGDIPVCPGCGKRHPPDG